MKINKKGFLLSEALVVATVLLTALVVIYVQYAKIYAKINAGQAFNTEDAIYKADELGKYFTNAEFGEEIIKCIGTKNFQNVSNCSIADINPVLNNFDIEEAYVSDFNNFNNITITTENWPKYLTFLNKRIRNDVSKPTSSLILLIKTTNKEYGYSYLKSSKEALSLIDLSPTSNLVFYTRGLAGSAIDSSGYENVISQSNITSNSNRLSQNNKAMNLDAPGSFTISNSASLNLNSFSVSMWLKYNGLSKPPQIPRAYGLVRKTSNTETCYLNSKPGFEFGHGSVTTGLNVCVSDGTNRAWGNVVFNSGNTPVDLIGKWHHLVVVVDRSPDVNSVFAYVNGVRQNSKLNISTVTGDISNSHPIVFGTMFGWHTNGTMDDVRIYNKALNFLEVAWLYDKEYSEGEL